MSSKFITNGFFNEPFFEDIPYETQPGFKVKEVFFDGKSMYQEVLIFDSYNHGRVLAIDGNIQITTSDEFSYHEMLAFTPLSCHRNPKKIFIVGGGDGGLLTQVLKFPSVESVVLCDIDEVIVEKCREYFPELTKVFDNPKCNLVNGDAFEYLKNCEQGLFDVIICDCTDPNDSAVSDRLFGEEFYKYVYRALSRDGIACSQTANNYWQYNQETRDLINGVKTQFPVVALGFFSVASFSCGQNGFLVCSKNQNQDVTQPFWSFDEKTLDGLELKYYDADLHKASFSLPRFLRKAIYANTDLDGKINNTKKIKKDT